MDEPRLARQYYRYIDEGAYHELAGILTESFVHLRPDRTLEGRDRFLEFMREERPNPDTIHHVETVYAAAGRVAVEGRLETEDGEPMFRFVDAFEFDGDRIERLRTYTD